MSRLLELNPHWYGLRQDFLKTDVSEVRVCVCCLDQTGPFVSLGGCTHMGLFANTMREISELTSEMRACVTCHEMLIKFNLFREQVKESLHKLCIQTVTLAQNKKVNNLNFSTSKLMISIPSQTSKSPDELNLQDTEIKLEDLDQEYQNNDELDISNEDTSLPLSEVKKELSEIKRSSKRKADDDLGNIKKTNKQKAFQIYKSAQFEDKYKGLPLMLNPSVKTAFKSKTSKSPEELNLQDTEIKLEDLDQEYQNNDELDISNEDTSLPLSEVKKELSVIKRSSKRKADDDLGNIKKTNKQKAFQIYKSAQFEDTYKGKIELITLTDEDVLAERESDKLKESYIKLPFKCTDCIRGFDHEATLKQHIDKCHTFREGREKCDLCKSYLAAGFSYTNHKSRHFKRYECVKCGKRNNTLHAVIAHYNECHGDTCDVIPTDYTCDECGATCASYRKYRYHTEKHRNSAREQCSECDKTFVNKTGLRIHILNIHKKSSRVYSCAPCNKVYNAKSSFLLHINSHHKASTAYCEPCRTHYRCESILRQHLRTHSRHVNERNEQYICADCGQKCLTKSSLIIHIKWTHLKEAYHCKLCSKAFKIKSSLRHHTQYVHERKRRPRDKMCDYCGRGFHTLQILRSHVRTHTGERPLQCEHCDATFAHPAARYTHTKLLHKHNNGNTQSNAAQPPLMTK